MSENSNTTSATTEVQAKDRESEVPASTSKKDREPTPKGQPTRDQPPVKIVNHGARPVSLFASKGFPGFTLRPGVNSIPAEAWKFIEDRMDLFRPVEELLRQGRDGGISVGGSGEDLSGASDLDAFLLVQASTDTDQLAEWRRTEKRKRILDAIDEQMDKVRAAQEKVASKAKK